MFVLPPPPRYPNGALYTGMPGGAPVIETSNTLEHPTGPEYQLVLGEGVYTLKDDLHLATPPPHPSDTSQPNNNPLATTIGPSTCGTKLSVVVLAQRTPPSQTLTRMWTSRSAWASVPSIQEEVHSPKSEAGSTNGFGSAEYYAHRATFGDGNPALVPLPTKATKKDQKAKPKSNIIKSNSSYVSRVIPHESLQKRLNERSPDGLFAFANVNRSLVWLDLSSETKVENMTKVLFTKAHVLCHDVNAFTKSSNHLDVALGFNTGDIIWYEPFSQKYARLNKNGMINSSPVVAILWVPRKENLLIAAHTDGSLVVYDKEKEDAEFVPEEPVAAESGHADDSGAAQSRLHIKKSVESRNQKTNPVAAWKLSNMQINAMAFSPDEQLLATAGEDGTLTIMDYMRERTLDVFRSYYGAILCVTWSPDGRYVVTGGQDDLVSIWSLADHALVARCVGHESWVTDVKFDAWRCDERSYRFGSVGEDRRMLLWDFSVGMLGRPKAAAAAAAMRGGVRGSTSSHVFPAAAAAAERNHSITTVARLRSDSTLNSSTAALDADGKRAEAEEVVHPVDSKASTAVLPPVMSKRVSEQPLCWLGFEEHCILTSCRDGHVREWQRPSEASHS